MNVILVVIDTLRADHLSAYGYGRDTSPNLARLQGTGVRFENAFVQCNFSGGSYASIFTGLYPHHHGVRDHPQVLAERHDTLAELFRGAGYRTFARHGHRYIGKQYGYHQGFEDYAFRETAEETTQQSIEFIEQVGDDPFFMFVQYKDPHFRYRPPERYRERWMKRPPRFLKRTAVASKNKTLLMFGFEELTYYEADLEYQVALYDGEIAYTDELLGKIDQALESAGVRDDTIIVVTADHGESLGEHGTLFNHDGTLYDEVMRVPLIIINPRLFPGPEVISAPVQSVDIVSTLADLVGIPDGTPRDGESMLPLVDEVDELRHGRFLFAEGRPLAPSRAELRKSDSNPIPGYRVYVPGLAGKWRSVRSTTHKLILIPNTPRPEWELYDVVNDPGEIENLIGRADLRSEQERLTRALEAWMGEDSGDAQEVEMTREVFEQLKEMGYVEGEHHDAANH